MSSNAILKGFQLAPQNGAAMDLNIPTEPALIYPARDPRDERDRLITPELVSLDALNHFGWAGARDLRAHARALVVGEGNGDAAVYLAEQARGSAMEIIAIDQSADAVALSKARLAARGLTNVTHHVMSILDLPQAGLGEFDIIECSHVLDHIEYPLDGLAALGAVLKDDGILALSVNATYGRLQLHMIQALMKRLTTDYMPRAMKIAIAREFLAAVPRGHLLEHNSADLIAELDSTPDNSAVVALLLQDHNHTFAAAEVYQMLDATGLVMLDFTGPQRAAYEVETSTSAPQLLARTAAMPDYQKHVVADAMHAGIRRHQCYAAIQEKQPAQFGEDMVIVIAPSVTGANALESLAPQSPNRDALLAAIDGLRTIAEILAQVGQGARAELEELYHTLHLHRRVFLRHKDVPATPDVSAMQSRLA